MYISTANMAVICFALNHSGEHKGEMLLGVLN